MTNEDYAPQLTSDDVSHLKALALAFTILGYLGMFLSLFPLIHIAVGIGIITGAIDGKVPPFMGWLLLGIGIMILLLGEALSICMLFTAKHLTRRTGYMFSFVVACIACINVPIGTILGILTIIVLSRPSVKAAFGET